MAAWLHDIGYAPELVKTGFHPLDGARYLRRAGVNGLVVSLVAYHSCAQIEAEVRRLGAELASEFSPGNPQLADAGTLAAGMIVILDRNFLSYRDYAAVAATGADSVWRASASFGLPVTGALADGSWNSQLRPPRGHGGKPVRVRIAEYAIETVFRCIKTAQRGGAEVVLRSKKPDGVLQEIWAILAVYQNLRHLICQAAAAAGTGSWTIPFARTLRAARPSAHAQAAFSP
jgi:hypothetical protein